MVVSWAPFSTRTGIAVRGSIKLSFDRLRTCTLQFVEPTPAPLASAIVGRRYVVRSVARTVNAILNEKRRQISAHCLNHLYTVKPRPPGAMRLRTRGHQFE